MWLDTGTMPEGMGDIMERIMEGGSLGEGMGEGEEGEGEVVVTVVVEVEEEGVEYVEVWRWAQGWRLEIEDWRLVYPVSVTTVLIY